MDPARTPADLPKGPFSTRLDAAIRRRGLGLQRLSLRLAELGISCSASTLSLWRNERTRPQRREGLRAVAALEEILETPTGYLMTAEHPVPKGTARWWSQDQPRTTGIAVGQELAQARADFGVSPAQETQQVAFFETVRVDAENRFVGSRGTLVLRAMREGVDRFITASYGYRDGSGVPQMVRLLPRSGVRLGRERLVESAGCAVAELVLASPLHRGETVAVSWDAVPAGDPQSLGGAEGRYERLTSVPVGQMSVRIDFDPVSPPRRLHAVTGADAAHPSGPPLPVRLQGSSLVLSATHLETGGIMAQWDWEGEDAGH